MTNGFSHYYHFDESTLSFRDFRCDFKILFHFFDEIPESKHNSPRWDPFRNFIEKWNKKLKSQLTAEKSRNVHLLVSPQRG